MAKHPGSKRSRSERKAGRERNQRAREHGLPEARELVPVAPERDSAGDASSYEPSLRSSEVAGLKARKGPPAVVWVVGVALLILAGVYVLSRLRDG